MDTKLVIFDLDGTLLATIDDLAAATNHALQQNGYPAHERSAYRYFVGNGITRLVERALPEAARDEETVMRVRRDFVDYYSEHNTDRTRPYPGIESLVGKIAERGVRMAVASNKYQAATAKLIDRYFPAGTFCVVLGQREGIEPKPDPTIVFDILCETGCKKTETLYVGDSKVDMLTAANSGLRSVGVTWGFRPRAELEEHGAKYIIDEPDRLLEIL